MNKETATENQRSNKANQTSAKRIENTESILPDGSWQRLTVGVAAAAGGGLIVASLVGVGPAAIAGAAGYLAYQGLKGQSNKRKATSEDLKH
jgi:hypothetical protein